MFICRGPDFHHHSPPDQSPVSTPLYLILQYSQWPKYWAHTIVALHLAVVYPAPSAKQPWGQTPTREWVPTRQQIDGDRGAARLNIRARLGSPSSHAAFQTSLVGFEPAACPAVAVAIILKTIWVGLFDGVMLWVGGLCMSWVPWPKMLYNYQWGWGQRGVLRSLHSQFKRVRNRRGTTHMLQGATWGV